jgi:hypothetical protein
MTNSNKSKRYSSFLIITAWAAMWGIFEASVGYLLHLFPISCSWLIWYPVACFFMANIYRKTGKVSFVFLAGLLSASIKMLNLLFPVRADKVINPAISIVFESLVMGLVILAVNHVLKEKRKNAFIKALVSLIMNTGWRVLFILFLLFLVPDWVRDISVISSADKFMTFFISQNLIISFILFIGYQFIDIIFRPIKAIENKIFSYTGNSTRAMPILKTGIVAFLFCVNIIFELLL